MLIVDDLDETREMFAEVLMHEGYHSIMARSGHEALARLEEVRPELIVTDLEMPEMNGAELIRRIRQDGRYGDVPIIVLTGAEADVVARVRDTLGDEIRAVLSKPVSLNDLLTAVAEAVSSRSR